ncbi:MAG TPA: hypothetical protein PKE66_17950 [Pyrinomonadaceae bacterium]|nr:hypothetical protein [Pyrinomonadaceae bacterium]
MIYANEFRRVGVLNGFVLLLFVVVATSCNVQTARPQGEPFVPYVADQIVVDTMQVLKDGHGMSWRLDKGKYKLEMTANNDGATAEWVGGGCAKTEPIRSVSMVCEMHSVGQLNVTNPTVFALGKDVSVTVRLTKLAR